MPPICHDQHHQAQAANQPQPAQPAMVAASSLSRRRAGSDFSVDMVSPVEPLRTGRTLPALVGWSLFPLFERSNRWKKIVTPEPTGSKSSVTWKRLHCVADSSQLSLDSGE